MLNNSIQQFMRLAFKIMTPLSNFSISLLEKSDTAWFLTIRFKLKQVSTSYRHRDITKVPVKDTGHSETIFTSEMTLFFIPKWFWIGITREKYLLKYQNSELTSSGRSFGSLSRKICVSKLVGVLTPYIY